MMTSRAIGPPARVELIGRTTHFSDSLSDGPDDLGCHSFRHPQGSAPRSGSGGRGGSPPADSPRQGLGACRATVEHDVPRARARLVGDQQRRGVVNTVPDPGSYRRPSEFGRRGRPHARRPPRRRTTARRACRRTQPESRPATTRARPRTPTWKGGSRPGLGRAGALDVLPSVHGAVVLASPLAIDHSQG